MTQNFGRHGCGFILGLSGFCLCFFGLGTEVRAAFSASDFRVNKKQIQVLKIEVPGKGFGALSAHLYGGDASYAKQLKKLNRGRLSPGASIRFPTPQYRIRPGDTFQKVGALLAGGSAKSYFKLLSINRHVKHPDHLLSGSWLNLERIPSATEQNAWKNRWAQADIKETPTQRAAASEPGSSRCEEMRFSIFEPQDVSERRELVIWYLERLEQTKDLARMDAMVEGLLAQTGIDWNDYYVAGKHYFQTERPLPAIKPLGLALKDEKAPIQVGLLYLRAHRMAKKPMEPVFLERLFQRYPSLQAIDAADAADTQ